MGFVKLTRWNGNQVYIRADRVDKVEVYTNGCDVTVRHLPTIRAEESAEDVLYQIHLAERGIDVTNTSGCGACNR